MAACVQECHEGITDREGYFVPCEKPAVGYRVDPTEGRPYPVCRKHLRADIFVPSYNAVLDDWQEREDEKANVSEIPTGSDGER